MSLKWRRRFEGFAFLVGFAATIAGLHLMTPFEVNRVEWWQWFIVNLVQYEVIETPAAYFIFGAPIAGIVLAIVLRLIMRYTAYGDARFATVREAKGFGLGSSRGMVLGALRGHRLVADKPRHVMVSAGTQSGKTQGVVIPTLLEYPGAVVVIDAKGELWDSTAAARSKFSDVYRLEWTSRNTARYNPISLKVLPDHPDDIERRVRQTASILAPSNKGGESDHWTDSAERLITALMLCEIFDARKERRDALITNVAHWCTDFDAETTALAQEAETPALKVKLSEAIDRAEARGYPKACIGDLKGFFDTSHRELSSVVNTVERSMMAFKSGAVRESLSECDFTARSLVQGARPGTVYIVVQPDDREAVASMTTALITNIVMTLVSRSKDEAADQHSILLLLEEFTSLKRTVAIPEAYDRGAGLGVHVMTIIQAFSQVREIYGRDALASFMQNTDYLVAFAQGDDESKQMLERLVGKTTRVRESRSNGGRGDSYQQGLEGVPLILAQDWGSLPLGEHIVLVKRHHDRPIRSKTVFAFKDRKYSGQLGRTPLPPVR